MEPYQHSEYPTLHTERLSERECELIAGIVEDRFRDLFELALSADDAFFRFLVAERRAEEARNDGVISTCLGELEVLRKALDAPRLDIDDVEVMRYDLAVMRRRVRA